MRLDPKLINAVDAIHQILSIESPDYCALLAATRNDEAVEGSLFDDEVMAAQMISD